MILKRVTKGYNVLSNSIEFEFTFKDVFIHTVNPVVVNDGEEFGVNETPQIVVAKFSIPNLLLTFHPDMFADPKLAYSEITNYVVKTLEVIYSEHNAPFSEGPVFTEISGAMDDLAKQITPIISQDPIDDYVPTILTATSGSNYFSNESHKLPGMDARVTCPDPDGDVRCFTNGKETFALRDIIIHLNDIHKWTRESIAYWMQDLHDKGEINIALEPELFGGEYEQD